MIQLFIWFDRHIVRLTYIGINMYMVYSLLLNVYSQNDPMTQSVRAPVQLEKDSGFESRCWQEFFVL